MSATSAMIQVQGQIDASDEEIGAVTKKVMDKEKHDKEDLKRIVSQKALGKSKRNWSMTNLDVRRRSKIRLDSVILLHKEIDGSQIATKELTALHYLETKSVFEEIVRAFSLVDQVDNGVVGDDVGDTFDDFMIVVRDNWNSLERWSCAV